MSLKMLRYTNTPLLFLIKQPWMQENLISLSTCYIGFDLIWAFVHQVTDSVISQYDI